MVERNASIDVIRGVRLEGQHTVHTSTNVDHSLQVVSDWKLVSSGSHDLFVTVAHSASKIGGLPHDPEVDPRRDPGYDPSIHDPHHALITPPI